MERWKTPRQFSWIVGRMETRGVSRPIAYPVNQLQVAPLGLYPVKWHVVVPAKLVEFRERWRDRQTHARAFYGLSSRLRSGEYDGKYRMKRGWRDGKAGGDARMAAKDRFVDASSIIESASQPSFRCSWSMPHAFANGSVPSDGSRL